MLLSNILLRVPQNLGELGRWVIDARRYGQDGRPAPGRLPIFSEPFVNLRDPDQRQKVGLIDRQRLLERGPLTLGLAEGPTGRRKIDPVRPFAGLAFTRHFKMHDRCPRVGPRQSIGAKPIAGGRLLVVKHQHCFEMVSRIVAAAPLASALPFGEVLLDRAGGHEPKL